MNFSNLYCLFAASAAILVSAEDGLRLAAPGDKTISGGSVIQGGLRTPLSSNEGTVANKFNGGGGGGGGGGVNGAQCQIFDQDCPEGYKCTVENIFASSPKCRPLVDNPDQVGDQCSELGDNDGDSCDIDGICLGGVCRGLEIAGTQCALDETSHFYPSGIHICERECDPLLAASCNVVPGSYCTRTEGSSDGIFSCFIDDDANLGGFADSCVDSVQCQQGSICLQSTAVPAGYCNGGGGATSCCVPLCDLDEEPNFCEGIGISFECKDIYNGSPPPGLEHVGACVHV